MKTLNLLISDAKDFMANEVNRLFVWVLVLNLIIVCYIHIEIKNLKQLQAKQNENLEQEIDSVRKRVDYRYFNMTRTMQDLYNIKIDTKNGELKNNL